MELPAHPESEDTASREERSTGTSWATVAVFVIISVLFAVIVILHLTGVVGPGATH
jgi:uncharacterized RDD family membrane protein YckC